MGFLAVLILAIQLIFNLGDNFNADQLFERLQSTDNPRELIWERYLALALESPIYGYSPSGLNYAILGSGGFTGVSDYLKAANITVDVKAVHNSYLAVGMRFGIVGLVLFLAMILIPINRARQVIFNERIPLAEKKNYILPTALVPAILFMIFFEDYVPGTGKGTVLSILFYGSCLICQVYGTRLLNEYGRKASPSLQLRTIEGFQIMSAPSASEKA
jgi:O-antigen ligase